MNKFVVVIVADADQGHLPPEAFDLIKKLQDSGLEAVTAYIGNKCATTIATFDISMVLTRKEKDKQMGIVICSRCGLRITDPNKPCKEAQGVPCSPRDE